MPTEAGLSHTSFDRERARMEIREQIVARLRDKEYRDTFVSEQINTGLAFQIRGLREQRGWTQAELGEKAGMAQARISVMEDANYSRFSLNTLKRLASALDVALVVRFAPFSELVNYFVDLNADSLKAPSFDEDKFVQQYGLPIGTTIKDSAASWASGYPISLSNVREQGEAATLAN